MMVNNENYEKEVRDPKIRAAVWVKYEEAIAFMQKSRMNSLANETLMHKKEIIDAVIMKKKQLNAQEMIKILYNR